MEWIMFLTFKKSCILSLSLALSLSFCFFLSVSAGWIPSRINFFFFCFVPPQDFRAQKKQRRSHSVKLCKKRRSLSIVKSLNWIQKRHTQQCARIPTTDFFLCFFFPQFYSPKRETSETHSGEPSDGAAMLKEKILFVVFFFPFPLSLSLSLSLYVVSGKKKLSPWVQTWIPPSHTKKVLRIEKLSPNLP